MTGHHAAPATESLCAASWGRWWRTRITSSPGIPSKGILASRTGWNWYDIDAKVAGSPIDDEIRLMFRTLLEERFKLKVHRETKEVPVYTLTQTRKGPKLKQWTEGAPP